MTFWRTKKNDDGSLAWEVFPPIDLNKLAKSLDPQGRGRSFGVANPDVSDETSLTAGEVEMLAPINRHISELHDWFRRRLGAIKDTINETYEKADLDETFNKITDEFSSSSKASVDQFVYEQGGIYTSREESVRELRAFRAKHDLLDRAATYPESKQLHLALVFAALIAESLANSYFFAKGSEIGLLGGFFQAVLISAANVSLSMIAGIALTQVNHIEARRKVAGIAGFLVCAAMIALLHLATAHYREALSLHPDVSPLGILSKVWISPFGLQDLDSVLLIAIGVVISSIAIWKGYTFDDSYPGYGRVFRKWQEIDDQLSEMELHLKREISQFVDAATNRAREALSELKRARKDMAMLEGDIDASLSSCDSYYGTARKAAVSLISAFRAQVHIVLNDQQRYAYNDDLLNGARGLEPLDLENAKEEIRQLYSQCLTHLDEAIGKFPARQENLKDFLEKERVRYASADAISLAIKNVGDERIAANRRVTAD